MKQFYRAYARPSLPCRPHD